MGFPFTREEVAAAIEAGTIPEFWKEPVIAPEKRVTRNAARQQASVEEGWALLDLGSSDESSGDEAEPDNSRRVTFADDVN